MADLLSEVEYGRILGSFTAVSEDFGDTVAPDAIPLSGRVTFVPSTSNISYINSEGETASLYLAPVNAVISQGRIVGKDGKDGVVLLASNSNNVSESVLWTARISLDPINSGDEAPETHSFLIEVRRGEIASLIDVIKENSRVHNIALFHDAIAEAAAKFWERVESGEFRGNQGPPGPPGVGVGVAGPRGMAGKNGADGAPGVGGNMIPDGDLESPGFLSYGDYQESYDAVSGDKSVSLTNATSRKIAVEPEKSYVGSVYVKSDYDVTFKVSLRVFGDQGDIDRVIDYSYEIPSGFWKKVTFLLDSEVGDQSVELIVSSDGRVVLVDNFWLSDNSAVRGLQTELVATQERIEAALDKLDTDIDQVDSERVKLTESLNDLSVILEDAEIDLGNVNNQLDDLRDALANAAVGDNYYRDQNLSKPSGFTEDPSVTHSEGGGFGGGGSITVAPGETVRGAYDTLTIDADSRTKVSRGTQYKISARIQPEGDLPAGGGYIAIRPVTVAGSTLPGDRLDPIYIMAPETPGGTWSEISEVVDIPEGTVEVMVGVFLDSTYGGSAVFSDIGVRKAIDGTIIAPGSVSAGQIAPDSIGTAHLIALAITADKIGANAIVAGKIDALAVNTRELAAEAVNAGKLAADSVIAGKVAADAISAREIVARSITAEKIESDSITANEIKARTITAAEIATGTILAEHISTDTLDVLGELTVQKLSGEHIYGTVIEGGEIRTSDNLAGQVILSDRGYVTHFDGGRELPGLTVIPPDMSTLSLPPAIGPSELGMTIFGGRSVEGGSSIVQLHPKGAFLRSFRNDGGTGSEQTSKPDVALMRTYRPDGTKGGEIETHPTQTHMRTFWAGEDLSGEMVVDHETAYMRKFSGPTNESGWIQAKGQIAELAYVNSENQYATRIKAEAGRADIQTFQENGNLGAYITASRNYAEVISRSAGETRGVLYTSPTQAYGRVVNSGGATVSRLHADTQEAYLYTQAGGYGRYLTVDATGIWAKTNESGSWQWVSLVPEVRQFQYSALWNADQSPAHIMVQHLPGGKLCQAQIRIQNLTGSKLSLPYDTWVQLNYNPIPADLRGGYTDYIEVTLPQLNARGRVEMNYSTGRIRVKALEKDSNGNGVTIDWHNNNSIWFPMRWFSPN